MDDSGQVTQASENYINKQITTASLLEKDAKGRKEDGEDDLANITRQIISIPFLFFSFQINLPNSQKLLAFPLPP